MRVIILAAGLGSRLRPHTDVVPKCLVKLGGKSLIHYQFEALRQAGINTADIAICSGYLSEKLEYLNVKLFKNEIYDKSNMVESLFCAESHMQEGEDLLICYSDIVYEPQLIKSLIDTQGEVVVSADLDWLKLWSHRMDDPLDDAETFKTDNGRICELGEKPDSYGDIEAQFVGLIKISSSRISQFIDLYKDLKRKGVYKEQPVKSMYMTSLLSALIASGWIVVPSYHHGGWIEVDTLDDLNTYEMMFEQGSLGQLVQLPSLE